MSLTASRSNDGAMTEEERSRAALGAPRCQGCGRRTYLQASRINPDDISRYCRHCVHALEAHMHRSGWHDQRQRPQP